MNIYLFKTLTHTFDIDQFDTIYEVRTTSLKARFNQAVPAQLIQVAHVRFTSEKTPL